MVQLPSRPLAVSLGDPAGIGPEVVAKCWDRRADFDLPPFAAIGDPRSIALVWDGPIEAIDDPRQADAVFDYALPIIQIASAEGDTPGRPSVGGAHCSLDSLEIGIGLTRSGSAAAVVTGPVSKEQLYAIGFTHPGQTEFVAERCGVSHGNVAMMLAGPSLRTVPVTTHVPFADVSGQLSAALIEARGRTDPARPAAQFRNRRSNARHFGAQSPRGRRRTPGQRRGGVDRARDRRASRRRLACYRPPPGGFHVQRRGARAL